MSGPDADQGTGNDENDLVREFEEISSELFKERS